MKIVKLLCSLGIVMGLTIATITPSTAADPFYKTSQHNAIFNWNGIYAGANIGYALGDIDYSAGGATINVEPRGYTLSGVLGYNMHFQSNLILGIEADLGYAEVDRTTAIAPGIGLNGGIDYFTTVRGRLGYSFGTWMVHVNGGWAGAHLVSNITGTPFSADEFISGWAYGVGAEFALTQNLWLTADWQRLDFSGSQNFGPGSVNADSKIDILKAGVKYRFGS